MNKKQTEDGLFLFSALFLLWKLTKIFQKVLQKIFDSNLSVRNVPSSVTEKEFNKVLQTLGQMFQ